MNEVPQQDYHLLKPHKGSYFFMRGSLAVLSLLIICIPVMIVSFIAGFIIALILIALYLFALSISYKKEEYRIYPHKAIRRYGTIFSSNSVELQFPRMVILEEKKPWILRLLFQTGTLTLKAAGSNSARFRMLYIQDVEKHYRGIESRLKANSFHLEKNRLVQEARPHILGILGEIFDRSLGGILFFVYVFGGGILSMAKEGQEFLSQEYFISGDTASLFIGVVIGILLLSFIFIKGTLSYLDLKRRKYDIYDDAVEYREGFLTHHRALIPMEAVSDVENKQSFFSRIFGLHDIKISCAGVNNDVVFRNMPEGETMIANLRYLKDAISPKEMGAEDTPSEKTQEVGYTDQNESTFDFNRDFTGSYRMDMKKSIIPSLFFLIPPFTPIGLATLVGQFIRVKFTQYEIAETSIEKRFHFLSQQFNSFNIEKITGVRFRESWIDKIFHTQSIIFMSIGNSQDIIFSNIKKTPEQTQQIKEKLGIYETLVETAIESSFSLGTFFKANIRSFILPLTVLTFFLVMAIIMRSIDLSFLEREEREPFGMLPFIIMGMIGFICFLFGISFFYKKLFYSQRFYKNTFSGEGVYSKKGIFVQTDSYALSRNIKGLSSIKYPLSQTGSLVFHIAGEQFIQTGKGKGQGFMRPYTIVMPYISQVQSLHYNLDTALHGTQLDTSSLKDTRQSLINSIFPLLIVGGITLIGSIFASIYLAIVVGICFLLLIGVTAWYVRVKYYVLESQRVRAESGIIYRTITTILYDRFNFIELNRGFFNTLFKNGSISVYTLGSGKRDMVIYDIDEYQEWYNELEKY